MIQNCRRIFGLLAPSPCWKQLPHFQILRKYAMDMGSQTMNIKLGQTQMIDGSKVVCYQQCILKVWKQAEIQCASWRQYSINVKIEELSLTRSRSRLAFDGNTGPGPGAPTQPTHWHTPWLHTTQTIVSNFGPDQKYANLQNMYQVPATLKSINY